MKLNKQDKGKQTGDVATGDVATLCKDDGLCLCSWVVILIFTTILTCFISFSILAHVFLL